MMIPIELLITAFLAYVELRLALGRFAHRLERVERKVKSKPSEVPHA